MIIISGIELIIIVFNPGLIAVDIISLGKGNLADVIQLCYR